MEKSKILGGRERVTVAVAQPPPVYMDTRASLERACETIIEAGRSGAELVAFSEAWLPGYPLWTEGWDSNIAEWVELRAIWQDCALIVPGTETDVLCRAAKEASTDVVIGVNELDPRPGVETIYNALLFIDRSRGVLGTHRKLCSPFAERTFYGPGDSSDVHVFEMTVGRVGGLICSEMVMSMLKAAMIAQGEDFHVASWVGAFAYDGSKVNDRESAPGTSPTHTAGRSYAMDAGCFVLNAEGFYSRDDVPATFPYPEKLHLWPAGGSSLFGPAGQSIAGPDYGSKIVYGVCEARDVKLRKGLLDSLGYYARPDCMRLELLAQNREGIAYAPGYSHREVRPLADLTRRQVREAAERVDLESRALEQVIEEVVARLSRSGVPG